MPMCVYVSLCSENCMDVMLDALLSQLCLSLLKFFPIMHYIYFVSLMKEKMLVANEVTNMLKTEVKGSQPELL